MSKNYRPAPLASLVLVFSLLGVQAATTNISLLVTTNSWKYNQSGIDLGTVWSQSGYDDTGWTNHRAVFYTDTVTPPLYAKTLLPLGPTTYYFRAHFPQNANPSLVTLSSATVLDDGAIVYVNGAEALRVGMPAGSISYSTQAARSVGNGVTETFAIPTTNLVVGDNVIAVELHQSSDLADVAFALSLDATVTYTNSPQMVVVLNEVLANNHTQTNANGFASDWVELYNPSLSPVDLSDMSLSTSAGTPRKWVFPAGSMIAAQGYLVIEFNNDYPSSPNNTGFTISAGSDTVYLFERPANGGVLVDAVRFGPQAADFSIGRIPSGSGSWTLNIPAGVDLIPLRL